VLHFPWRLSTAGVRGDAGQGLDLGQTCLR
jgi:hypothetical protein